jgi:hypothetical protein
MRENGDGGIRGPFSTLTMESETLSARNTVNTMRLFYQTIVTIGQRINCPCLVHNLRTVNRMYKVVFGKDLPEEDTDVELPEHVLKPRIKEYYVDLCEKAGEIVHADATSTHAKKILKEFNRVHVIHQMVC